MQVFKAILLAIAFGFSFSAYAGDQLKAGQWDMATSMKMKGMPQITAEERAAMKQMGIEMPAMGEPVHTMQCITPEQSASKEPPNPMADPNCKVKNLKQSGGKTTGDLVCKGNMNATGKFETTVKENSFYSKMALKGESGGQPIEQEVVTSGKWIKAKCDPAIIGVK